MSDEEARGPTRRSMRLPATLLLIMVVAIGGAILWLTAEPPAGKSAPPTAEIDLAPGDAPKPEAPKPGAPKPEASASIEAAPTGTAPATPAIDANPPQQIADHTAPPGNPAPPTPASATIPPENGTAGSPPQPQTAPHTEPAPQAGLAEEKPLPSVAAASDSAAPDSAAPDDPTVAPPIAPVVPRLPRVPPSPPLTTAPDPALIEETAKGQLPTVGRDGREAWRVYARPFDPEDKRPRIAVVLYGLGSSASATRAAIQGLPGAITLAFTPYADGLRNWIADARVAGHEALLMVPMEPNNYPDFDPGPQALLTSLSSSKNTDRLEWMLGRGVGYVGVTDFMGSRFTNSTRHMQIFFQNLKKRGLLYVESRTSARTSMGELASAAQVPFAANMLYVDGKASRIAIDSQLREAERLARRLGSVTVMGYVYPVTLERVGEWASAVEKRGFVLAPVSAIAARKER